MYLSHLRIWPVTFLSVQHLTVTSCSVHLPEQPTAYLRQVQMQATLQAFLFLIFLRLLRFSVSKIWLLPYIFAFIHLYGINKILPFLFWYRFVYTDFYYTPFILKIPPLLLSYFYQLLKYFVQATIKSAWVSLNPFPRRISCFVLFSFVVPYISRGYFAVSSATIPLTFSMLSSL